MKKNGSKKLNRSPAAPCSGLRSGTDIVFSTRSLALGGLIAAMYIAATVLSQLMGLASGVIQLRLSEALCILPVFSPAAVFGLFLGCFLSNLITGALLPDVIFGSLATLAAALGTRLLRKNRIAAGVPPVIVNMLVIPVVLAKCYKIEDSLLYLMITVGLGEFLSAGVLGQILYSLILRRPELKSLLEGQNGNRY